MISMEETGKNIEEATQKALDKLKVTEDAVDVEILEEGARGFLGIGQSPAKVRVSLKEAPPAEPRPRQRQRSRVRPEQRQEPRQDSGREPRQEQRQEPRQEPRQKPAPRQAPRPAAQRPEPQPEAKQEPRSEPRPPRRPRQPRQEPKPEPRPQPIAQEIQAPAPVREQPLPAVVEAPVVLTPQTISEAGEFARDLLQRILDALENGGNASLKNASESQIALDISGGDAPRLIGKHGHTINAMQYLVGIALNRKYHGRMRMSIDVEGYRTRREEAIEKQALQLAQQVKENGQEAVLESLDASERRLIHSALVNDPDVYTYSEGEEPERHLIISPRK